MPERKWQIRLAPSEYDSRAKHRTAGRCAARWFRKDDLSGFVRRPTLASSGKGNLESMIPRWASKRSAFGHGCKHRGI
jgi:hypothetical protein